MSQQLHAAPDSPAAEYGERPQTQRTNTPKNPPGKVDAADKDSQLELEP
jgi:hypothetical protein